MGLYRVRTMLRRGFWPNFVAHLGVANGWQQAALEVCPPTTKQKKEVPKFGILFWGPSMRNPAILGPHKLPPEGRA